ncbi:MAG: hypothetical protein KDJ65_41095, partial [Anaerolineae bacterium]|nr:hypothetical protein [Anaerolineae bacterium]
MTSSWRVDNVPAMPIVPPQQAHPVERHQERCAHVGQHGHPHGAPPGHDQQNEDQLDADADGDVGVNRAQRGPGQGKEERQPSQVVAHDADVGGFHGLGRAGMRGAQRDAHIGP